jgi:uncharacterized RDD family membrane protein YckC
MSLQIETAQNVGVDYEIASVGDRILAQLIDYAVYACWFVAMAAFGSLFARFGSFSSTWLITGAMLLPVMLYPLLCEYFLDGQTLGKMALKIRVMMLDGSKARLSSYLLRWLLIVVDVSIFSGLVAVLTIVINGKGQRLGDIAGGTAVVKTQPAVRLGQLLYSGLTPDYTPSFPSVTRLSDKDISTLRKVIASGNLALQETAVHKIEGLINVNSLDEPKDFLTKIVSDYTFYATQETES